MKNTENQSTIGQGISNHFYTQQVIDTKTILIRDLILPGTNDDGPERTVSVPKSEPLPPMWAMKSRNSLVDKGIPL